MNIYQKLNEARTRFHSLELKKTGHNKFAGYNYFELGDFLIPALKVFKEVGLCATVSFDPERAHMLIINVDDPKEMMSIFSPMGSAALKGCHEVQNIGAVETYQRRYLWVAALEIVEHDALDSSEPVKEAPKGAQTARKGDAPRTTGMRVREAIQRHLAAGREMGALQEWQDMHNLDNGEEIASIVWSGLTTPEQNEIRRLQSEAAKETV